MVAVASRLANLAHQAAVISLLTLSAAGMLHISGSCYEIFSKARQRKLEKAKAAAAQQQ
jgi:hypothetical protein